MARKPLKIGLFGGSFNPIHKGHIKLAEYAIKHLELDELIFIPCYKSTDKELEIYADFLHRINMILLVLPPKCSISTYEISKLKEVESIETIEHFRKIYPEEKLFFIAGEDILKNLDTWKDYQKIDKLVDLVIFKRLKSDVNLDEYFGSLYDLSYNKYIGYKKYLHNLKKEQLSSSVHDTKGLRVIVMDNQIWDASSSNIRNKNKTCELDEKVEIYLRENKLYGFFG